MVEKKNIGGVFLARSLIDKATPVRTAGNPSIHTEKDQMFCVEDCWSSALKQVEFRP